MTNETSDTDSTNSNVSGSVSGGSSTKCLKALTGAKSKMWKYFRFAMNETGAIVNFVKMTLAFVETRQI